MSEETVYTIDEAIARMMKLQDENDELKKPSYTWVPLIAVVCSLFYMHGMALGWYTCPK